MLNDTAGHMRRTGSGSGVGVGVAVTVLAGVGVGVAFGGMRTRSPICSPVGSRLGFSSRMAEAATS